MNCCLRLREIRALPEDLNSESALLAEDIGEKLVVVGGMSWIKGKIGDFCLVGDGAHASIKRQDDGVLYLTCKNFKDGKLDLLKASYITESDYSKHFKSDSKALTKPKAGDVLFSIIGTIGEPYLYKDEDLFGISSSVSILRPNNNFSLHASYLYYWIKNREFQKAVIGMKGGVAQGYLSLDMIRALPIRYPSLSSQEKIASILSAYDDLIENNRRRIQLLEQAARLLYREWFVHLRFPGHEHATITDGVPEGWEKKKISDVCETVGGGTPSTKVSEYWEGDITWVVPSDVTKNDCLVLLDSERKITEKGLRESSAKMVPAKTILMTSRASVGFFALMDTEVCTNQGFINIIPHEDELRMYLLFNLISRVTEIQSNAKGTTYPEISKGRFRELDIVVPSKTIFSEFSRFASGIIREIHCLKRSTQQLEKARDLFLPRLMNGEIAV